MGKATSCARTANTGTPQGCVLSPALLSRYTADCRSNSDANLLIKFADDTSLTGLVEQDEAAYRGRVQELAEWCDSNFLELNVSKTKELIVNFRAAPTHTEPITIKGQSVEMVSAYRYLGTVIDNKLPWTPHIDACCKKTQKKMYLLDQVTIQLFYQAIIENAIFFNLIYFFSSAKKGDTRRLDNITRTAESIISVHRTSATICSQETIRYSDGHFPSTPRRCSVLHNSKGQLSAPSQSEVPDNTPTKQSHSCSNQTAQRSPLTLYLPCSEHVRLVL